MTMKNGIYIHMYTIPVFKLFNQNSSITIFNRSYLLLEVTCEHDDFTNQLFEDLAKRMSMTLEKLGNNKQGINISHDSKIELN